jgi:hypothetical protein
MGFTAPANELTPANCLCTVQADIAADLTALCLQWVTEFHAF